MTTGSDWYAQRQFDQYPLMPHATAVDDNGELLPTGFIRDIKLRFTGPPDAVAFVGELTVTPQTLTVIIRDQNEVLAGGTVLRASLAAGARAVPLAAVSPGVVGRVALADVSDVVSGRWLFSTPAQSGLLPMAATPTIAANTRSRVSRDGFAAMSGPRIFVAGDIDVEVLAANRMLDGEVRESLVVRLNSAAISRRRDEQEASSGQAVYQIGCGARPESKTCQQNAVETINRVPPDCCGRLYVELQGCGTLTSIADGHGVQLDCEIAPEALCPPSRLPDQDGRLPTNLQRPPAECDTTTSLDSQDI